MGPCLSIAADRPPIGYPIVVMIKGTVEVAEGIEAEFKTARTNQVLKAGARLRTMERSRATILTSDQSTIEIGELGLLELPPEPGAGLGFLRGLFYFFHRDEPGTSPVRTPTSYSLIRGTEFNVEVKEDGTTVLTMFDGQVEMENAHGRLTLAGNEQAIVEPNQGPRQTSKLFGVEVIQWALYYPGVLRLEDLEWDAPPEAVRESIAAYRTGDLPGALARYPAGRAPESDHEKVYLGALLSSMGLVEQSQALLGPLTKNRDGAVARRFSHLSEALLELMAAVKFQESNTNRQPELASEWLARSYYFQSRSDLDNALAAARASVQRAPDFGFAWARVAELEFGFGRTRKTASALDQALRLSPRNAQAVALDGFVFAADNRIGEAMRRFDQAIAMDSALGNAWLGRGLCRIRRGDAEEGRKDLLVAATLEPHRALLRSYLGKAYNNEGDLERAGRELDLAKRLDPNDPTAWLYSALLNQQRNLINQAVRDLEESKSLNDNRSLYRSRLLLDQDRAVRGANLAGVYQDAGLDEVSGREAAQAINADYANYSAHQFLANSYSNLRDPGQVNLRYETPFFSEYLVANLLAPAGAGMLSPQVSQQEYSRLFERDRFGLVSATEYYSGGDWVQSAAQYGIWDKSAYSAEVAYRNENGDRRNNDFEQTTLNLRVKQELTPDDSVYVQAVYYNAEGGDLAQRYDPERVNTTVRIKERQEPIVLAGYHHQWAPGSHSLLLAGRIDDTVLVSDQFQGSLLFDRSLPPGDIIAAIPTVFDQKYRSEFELYTVEGQQIWQQEAHTLIVGARYQRGEFDVENSENNPRFPVLIPLPISDAQDESPDLDRANAYAYWQWRIWHPFLVVAGASYDWVRYPVNHRFGPVTDAEEENDKVSPKAGFIWTPLDHSTMRFAYTRSLGGVSLDQSFRLEPTQVAGFNQAYRSLIPESAAGVSPVPEFETWGVSLEQKFGSGTYLGLAYDWLGSEERRDIGVFQFDGLTVTSASTPQRLDYREQSGIFTINQLLGQRWSAGARYRLSHADLDQRFDGIPSAAAIPADPVTGAPIFFREQHLEGLLHQGNLFALYQHPCGFFSRVDALWTMQDNDGYSPAQDGDDFWQFNAFVGYRFLHRRAEARLGVLNLTDEDYRINPLNLTARMPRDRTLAASFRFVF